MEAGKRGNNKSFIYIADMLGVRRMRGKGLERQAGDQEAGHERVIQTLTRHNLLLLLSG